MKKYIQVLILMCGVLGVNLTNGQSTIISTNGEGSWGDPAMWVGGIIPGENDSVVIAHGATIYVDQNAVVRALTIGPNSTGAKSTLIINDHISFSVLGSCYLYRGREAQGHVKSIVVGTRYFDFEIFEDVIGTGENAKLSIKGDLTIVANTNKESGIDLIGLAELELAGNMILSNNYGYLDAPSTSTVILSGTSPQQIYMGYGTGIKYPNLVIEGHSVTVVTYPGATGNGVIEGDLIVKSGGVFDNAAKKIDVGKDILIEEYATFRLSGNSVVQVNNTNVTLNGKLITEHTDGLGGFKPLDGISLGGNAEIEYAGNTSNQVAGFHWFSSNSSYPRLTFNNVNGTSLDRSVSVGNVTIESGAIFNGTNNNGIELTVTESWTNNGTFNGQAGAVRLAGTTSTLLGTGVNNFNNLIIDSGVDFSAPEVLTVSGNLTVSPGGNFNHNNGRVIFKPTGGTQQTAGVGQFWDVTVEGGVIFNGQDTINHEFYLLSGTSSIQSSASLALNLNSGYINPNGNGTIIGDINLFKSATRNGYSYLSFPVPTSIGRLRTNGFNHVFNHEESRSATYIEMKDTSSIIPVNAKGYACYAIGQAPTVRLKGPYNAATSVVSVELTSTYVNEASVPGKTSWNLVGNPFVFDLDWDELKEGQDVFGSFYVSMGDKFIPYVNDVPAGGNRISALQGFMVYLPRTGETRLASFQFRKTAGLSDGTSPLYRKAPVFNVLKLEVSNGSHSDATYLRLTDDATLDFDSDFDAFKLKNSGNHPSFYSYINGNNYSINSFPSTFSRFSMPLAFEPKVSGYYSITLSEEYTYDLPYEVYLEDKFLNVLHPIASEPYAFSTNMNEGVARFALHFENPVITAVEGTFAKLVRVHAEDRDIVVYGLQIEEPTEIYLYDIAGRLIARHNNVDLRNKSFSLKSGNSAGIYIVTVISGEKTHSERVVVY